MANSPDVTLPIVQTMQKRWRFVDDLSLGWEGVVEKNLTTYLPKGEQEQDQAYEGRSKKATYFDYFNTTIDGLKGLVFQKPIILNDDIPDVILNTLDNIDSTGNSIDVFAKKTFDTALRKGLSYIYVDMPKKPDNLTNRTQEEQLGIRPYWVNVMPENIINFRTEQIGGNTVLTQMTIREFTTRPDGQFGEEIVTNFRVLTIGHYDLYEAVDGGITLVDSGDTGLDIIPIVALNLDDNGGYLIARPPFYDLGRLNIRHYQNSSDTAYASYMANVPMLKILGLGKDEIEKVVISANSAITSERSADEVEIDWLDYKGDAIETNMTVAKSYETQIALMGLNTISDTTVEKTATESVLEFKQKQSKLNSWTTDLEDAINLALYFTALYNNLDDGGSIEINSDIMSNVLTPEEMKIYVDMVAKSELSVETLWSIMKADKKLPRDFNETVEKERISEGNLVEMAI